MNPTREQMELAAKAAGIKGWWNDALGEYYYKRNGLSRRWLPHDDGDDSQRLQVKLRMSLDYQKVGGRRRWLAVCRQSAWESTTKAICFNPAIPNNDLRAMREAIFLVAVEIGRSMK